ncbi:hypothetical protein O181_011681 [Austropuccinia psidii MF-1]|uniref:Uncharacterized protein n=1 Tax=Austropuccinia psidii MF-1 TaxID=1389203 RepID=A0A9Q3BW74_9BASI|nr:hypothetical protein [Austropuccinia psidii MF-1]
MDYRKVLASTKFTLAHNRLGKDDRHSIVDSRSLYPVFRNSLPAGLEPAVFGWHSQALGSGEYRSPTRYHYATGADPGTRSCTRDRLLANFPVDVQAIAGNAWGASSPCRLIRLFSAHRSTIHILLQLVLILDLTSFNQDQNVDSMASSDCPNESFG